MFRSIQNTLIAMICSGVGAVAFWACCSSATSDRLGTSPGVKVVVDSFLASSSTSLDANKFLASSLSYYYGIWSSKSTHKRSKRFENNNNNNKEALYWSCGNSIKCMNEHSTYMTVTSYFRFVCVCVLTTFYSRIWHN